MKTKRNPLSYLGWLGVLGVLGLFFVPMFIPFLLCFTFFAYSNMLPDELFWKNVNRAAAKAFWSVFAVDVVAAFAIHIRAMFASGIGREIPITIEGDIVTMGIFTWEQFFIVFMAFFGSITLMILVFTISMMRFKKQEKKLLAEDAE